MVKNAPANTGDTGSIPGSDRLPGGGHGNPLQYSCLGNPVDRGAWWATAHGVTKSQTRLKRFSTRAHRMTTDIQIFSYDRRKFSFLLLDYSSVLEVVWLYYTVKGPNPYSHRTKQSGE